jgi:hypothetical protein
VGIAQPTNADGIDESNVSLDERGEARFVLGLRKMSQQVAIVVHAVHSLFISKRQ